MRIGNSDVLVASWGCFVRIVQCFVSNKSAGWKFSKLPNETSPKGEPERQFIKPDF